MRGRGRGSPGIVLSPRCGAGAAPPPRPAAPPLMGLRIPVWLPPPFSTHKQAPTSPPPPLSSHLSPQHLGQHCNACDCLPLSQTVLKVPARRAHVDGVPPHLPRLYLMLAAVPELALRAAEYSGQLPQRQRSANLQAFREGQAQVLVASDAATRGIDLPDVAAVVNYDAPAHAKLYVHRAGRTARAGKPGEVGLGVGAVVRGRAWSTCSVAVTANRGCRGERGVWRWLLQLQPNGHGRGLTGWANRWP